MKAIASITPRWFRQRPPRFGVARAMGVGETRGLSAGEGLPEHVDVVFETSGALAALGPVLRATARGGVLVQVGNLPGTPSAAALGDLVTREIT
ncbi:hypothetical protein [Streptomyces sp. NPDC007904]|uniref:hypothetical protein n=1 Tax=Streptomyces sp. NPDC007904 TaxID=3364787 RepID=UPI0036E5BD7C